MPPILKCGAKEDTALTQAILEHVKKHPQHSVNQVSFAVGCCKDKTLKTFKQHQLNYLWQRLRYADVELKELDPDLIKARENRIETNGPGDLVHIDAKSYCYIKGAKVLGITVVDNYSGFATLYISKDSKKSAENSVNALIKFRNEAPIESIKTLYSDNGTEFVNSLVLAWTEQHNLRFKQTKPGHPWSNGKAEVTQRLIKREVILPLLVAKAYDSLEELDRDVQERMRWFNYERPHFGRTNKGLTPAQVAVATDSLEGEAEREEVLFNLRQAMKWKNRAEWERANTTADGTD